jgi:hypothetical protein
VYPSVHQLNRQATRERLAASKSLTETAKRRHLELAEYYSRRAEQMQKGEKRAAVKR